MNFAGIYERFYAASCASPPPTYFTLTRLEVVDIITAVARTREEAEGMWEEAEAGGMVLFGVPVRIRPLRAFALHV